jgi:hypothetical protein
VTVRMRSSLGGARRLAASAVEVAIIRKEIKVAAPARLVTTGMIEKRKAHLLDLIDVRKS